MSDSNSNPPVDHDDPSQYPIGTIVYYEPDEKITTKITAGIVLSRAEQPILKKWSGTDITTDPQVLGELGKFFKDHGVKQVVMTNGNAGCPHEEGIDYPAGEECPYCPYWNRRQGTSLPANDE